MDQTPANFEERIRNIEKQLKPGNLEERINKIEDQLTPDNLGKKIDYSYLSINNTKLFLQIISIIQSIFLAGAIAFGYIGLNNIFEIKKEAEKVKEIRKETEDIVIKSRAAADSARKIVLGIKKSLEEYDAYKAEIGNKVESGIKMSNDNYAKLKEYSDNQMDIQKEIENRLSQTEINLKNINEQMKNISSLFNTTTLKYESELTDREKQLLFLLARENNPTETVFNYNYAYFAYEFGRYEDAIKSLDVVLNDKHTPEKIRNEAIKLKTICVQYQKAPPQIKVNNPSGVTIGPYSIIGLHQNTLELLVRKGYLSNKEAQGIFDNYISNKK